MVFENFEALKNAIPKDEGGKIGAVACAHDKTTLAACVHCKKEANISFYLVGDSGKIATYLQELGENPADFELVDAADDVSACKAAVMLVREQKAEFLLKGKVDTSVLLKAVVNKEEGLYDGKLMSHLAFMQIPGHSKLVVLTDSGMVTLPNKEQLKVIAQNAVDTLQNMGYDTVYGAMLAAAEKVNPKVPATQLAADIAEMSQTGELTGCHIEGPLSYDILMSAAVAEKKGYVGKLPGNCDLMLVPDMAMGNVLGKALNMTAKAKMAGIIVGAKAPIALTSRGSSDEEKINSILLAASAAKKGE